MDAQELRVATARFLRDARRADPERFKAIARAHPVLSTYRIDRLLAQEVELHEGGEDESGEYSPGTLDQQIHREWLETAFQEAA